MVHTMVNRISWLVEKKGNRKWTAEMLRTNALRKKSLQTVRMHWIGICVCVRLLCDYNHLSSIKIQKLDCFKCSIQSFNNTRDFHIFTFIIIIVFAIMQKHYCIILYYRLNRNITACFLCTLFLSLGVASIGTTLYRLCAYVSVLCNMAIWESTNTLHIYGPFQFMCFCFDNDINNNELKIKQNKTKNAPNLFADFENINRLWLMWIVCNLTRNKQKLNDYAM